MKQVKLTQVQKALLYIKALGHTEADIVSTGDDPVEDGLTVTVHSKQILIEGDPPVYQSLYIRLHQSDVEAFAGAYDTQVEYLQPQSSFKPYS
tara:strand:+ start:173 stop:451 length:279 start_codon:yes stop_codon:yes gene_type:complete